MILRDVLASSGNHAWSGYVAETTLGCAGMGCVALAASSPVAPAMVAAVVLAAVVVSGADVRFFARSMALASGFLLAGCAGMTIGFDFRSGWVLGFDSGALPRVVLAASRSLGCVACTMFFAQAVPFSRSVALMRRLRFPDVLIEIAVLVNGAILVMDRSLEGLLRALGSRNGFAGARQARRSSSLAAGSLLSRAFLLGRRQEIALRARNWNGPLGVLHEPVEFRPAVAAVAVALPLATWTASRWLDGVLGF